MGVSGCLTPCFSFYKRSSLTEQVISAYQEEQDNAEGKDAVTDKEHQYHSNGNPE